MKRLYALFAVAVCLLMLLTSCGKKETPSDGTAAVGERKIGLGSVCSTVMDGTDKCRVKATVAAVIVDKDGKIQECRLNELEFTVTLAGGQPQPVTDLTTPAGFSG